MELIRCDNCEREIRPVTRHFAVTLQGSLLTMADSGEPQHFCSEGCIAAYYIPNKPTEPIPAATE